jgi:hypothetical protein
VSQLASAIRSRLLLLLATAGSGAALAQADADARLRALETEVQQLKQRLDALEGGHAVAAPAAAAPRDCPGWGELRMSQTQAEVRRLLGEPAKVEATPLRIVWRYPCGAAYFDADTRRFVGHER